MSLLMEALRKAEEAKSKASSKDDKDSADRGDSSSVSAESLSSDTGKTATPKDSPTIPELEPMHTLDGDVEEPGNEHGQGPVVINPDPDEEETLASHFADAELDTIKTDTTDIDDELEKIEFSTDSRPPTTESPKPEPQTPDSSFDDDDGLSLLQSSYFTRTQKPGGPNFADFELDDLDTDDELAESATETQDYSQDASALTDKEEPVGENPPNSEPSLEEKILEEIDSEQENIREAESSKPDLPAHQELNKNRQSVERELAKAKEKENRSSASSLFLAKKASQKQDKNKFRAIAAVLLILPVAGIAYWFYSSYTSTSQMQFTVPANNELANREFLGSDVNAEVNSENVELTDELSALQATEQPEELSLALTDTPIAENSFAEESANQPIQSEQLIAPQPAIETAANTAPPSTIDVAQNPNQLAQDNVTVTSPVPENVATTDPAAETAQQTAQEIASPNNNTAASRVQPQSGLNFVKTAVTLTINPDLNAAYDSYQNGDFAAAGRLYQQVLNSEPNNRDAILGLASVYLNQGNNSFSQNLYARLLELNPRDPLAMAGLLEVSMRDDPVRQESELKSLVNAYPGIAPLSYALGNLYASQNRWTEAQNAYFNALLSAKSANNGAVNPDYAFNLAVSLERVNQLPAALDYYREAEEFSRFTAPGFNPALLQQRLNYLEQRVP